MKLKSYSDFKSDKPRLEGAYLGVPSEEYHATEALSRSALEPALKSMAHMKYNLDNPKDESDDMKFGTFFHTSVLEPELISELYTTDSEFVEAVYKANPESKNPRATKIYKALMEQNEKIVVTQDDWIKCQLMTASVKMNEDYKDVVQSGYAEVSFFGYLEGVLCKCRTDWFEPGRAFIVDLKSTRDASVEKFVDDAYRRGYHRQAAFYLDLVTQVTGIVMQAYGIVATEKEPPYLTGCHQFTSDFLGIGREEYKMAFAKYRESLKSGKYPGYPRGWQELMPKPWMFYRSEEI